MRASRSEALDGFWGPAGLSGGGGGSEPYSRPGAGIERQQRGSNHFVKYSWPPPHPSADNTHIKIENKHNRRTYTLLRCPPHLLPCPATRFTAVPVASATCSLWIFFFFFLSRCSSFFHFSGPAHVSAIIQDRQDTLSFSRFPRKK